MNISLLDINYINCLYGLIFPLMMMPTYLQAQNKIIGVLYAHLFIPLLL